MWESTPSNKNKKNKNFFFLKRGGLTTWPPSWKGTAWAEEKKKKKFFLTPPLLAPYLSLAKIPKYSGKIAYYQCKPLIAPSPTPNLNREEKEKCFRWLGSVRKKKFQREPPNWPMSPYKGTNTFLVKKNFAPSKNFLYRQIDGTVTSRQEAV